MKKSLLAGICYVLVTVSASAIEYTITLPVGSSLIANQLDHGSNTFNILFPNDGSRDGDAIEKYNCTNFTIYYFDSGSPTGFDGPDEATPVAAGTLSPGEGAMYINNQGADSSVTFTGTPHVPVLPATLPCGFGHQNLLSRQTNDVGTYLNITGYNPTQGAALLRFTGSGYTLYSFTQGAWSPSNPPSLNIGESAIFIVPAPGPLLAYTNNIQAGLNLIANQLDHGSNTLTEVMPGVPDGCAFYKYSNATTNWVSATYSSALGSWTPANLTLGPGEGGFIQSPSAFSLVLTGTPHVPVLPVTVPNGACYLLSRQTNDVGNYLNILGSAPTNGAKLYRWNNLSSTYTTYFYPANLTASNPSVNIGEAVWISPTGVVPPPLPAPPGIVQQPQDLTLPIGRVANFHLTASGPQPLTYSWFDNGVQISTGSSNFISIPSAQVANAGRYWAVVENSLGAVTSRVATLNILPQVQPSGLSLSINNMTRSNVLVNIFDSATLGFPWQLQSTTNLLNPNWVVEINGAGDTQMVMPVFAQSKFFRAARMLSPGDAGQVTAAYGLLPSAQFNTGLLMAQGSRWDPMVTNANGTPLDIDSPVPTNQILTTSDFRLAYNTLRADTLTNIPTLPDLTKIKVSIYSNAEPVRVEQNLAFQHVYALAVALIPYNTIDTNAFADGRLIYVDSNNIPISVTDSNELTANPPISVAPGSNSAPYVQTNMFAGAGLFRTVLQMGSEPIQFMLPKEYLIATGIVDTLQIRFPDAPLLVTNNGSNYLETGFVDIAPDRPFTWDLTGLPLDTNNEANVSFVVRAYIGNLVYDCAGQFLLKSVPAPTVPYSHCFTTSQYFYPQTRPDWWPDTGQANSWQTKPADPKTFFTAAQRPSFWQESWPCPYYNYPYHYTGARGHPYLLEYFGIETFSHDPQVWGPLWNSNNGAINAGTPNSGGNWSDGYNVRLYPATFRANDPNRCQALNPILIVDGIDTWSGGVARTEEDMWVDFGLEGQKLLDKGYDLLVLNYVHGDDWIQRNGLALLTVLQNFIPGNMLAGHEYDRVTIVSASMGTQVTRYALVKAEQTPLATLQSYGYGSQDHHTGLAIYLDGPFLGANISFSSQSLLWYLANNVVQPSSDAQDKITEVLLSPAAQQLLQAGISYLPAPAHPNFYGEMSQFTNAGLPYHARNVAVSCGSGIGLQQVNPPGPAGNFTPENLAYVGTGQLSTSFGEWGEVDVTSKTEGPTAQGSQNPVLSAGIQGGVRALFANSAPVAADLLQWDILDGARPSDLSPGGFTTLTKSIVDAYNSGAGVLNCMTGFANTTFIPLYSGLYVRSAQTSNSEPVTAHMTRNFYYPATAGIYSHLVSSGPISQTFSGNRASINYWYAPENNPSGKIDPQTSLNTAFDAIWYQGTENVDHVIDTGGNYLLPGYEAFVFNEVDQFTANEPFTSESILHARPKLLQHEDYLPGDLLNTGVDELLTINTMTRNAMVQSFDPSTSTWNDLWDNLASSLTSNPGQPGWIGSWAINRGDKFFLTRLQPGGPKLLLSFSTATPAWAMVQELVNNGGVYSWNVLWHNGGNGQFATDINFTIRPTDLYAFGDTDASGFEKLLVAYPYVCANGQEQTVPGTSGLSKAALLTFTGSGWTENWDNYSGQYPGTTIDFVGQAGIRFGDRLMFGRLNTPQNPNGMTNTLFSINLLRGGPDNSFITHNVSPQIFAGPSYLQQFSPTTPNSQSPGWLYPPVWTDGGVKSPNTNGCDACAAAGNIDCWDLGSNARDEFYFADLFGSGHDELIDTGNLGFMTWEFGYCFSRDTYTWLQWVPYVVPTNGNVIGVYQLGIGDRFVFGHFSANFAGDLVLSLNPEHQGTYRGPAVMQQYTINNNSPWTTVWSSTTSLSPVATSTSPPILGHWQLYQDLPQ